MEFAIIILATLTVVVECGHYTSAYGNYQPAYSTNTWANWNYPPITGYSWPYTYSTNYGNNNNNNCRPTITTVSGRFAPSGQLCSGQLILNEEFNNFAKDFWQHEITLGGGGNGEFQWYVSDDNNSFVENGQLNIRPTLTVDTIGDYNLRNDRITLNPCTNDQWNGCERQATNGTIINPVRSARLRTINTFSFKYGRVEVVAKMPSGDWLWPAVWLLPTRSKYGTWPRSGEIDLIESRGNRNYVDNNQQIGVERTTSTLHFGPSWDRNGFQTSTYSQNNPVGYNNGFHRYELEWTDSLVRFSVDGTVMGTVPVGNGFWERGNFTGDNIWRSGDQMAPFDDEFHFIVNLAVGGTNNFFPDAGNGNGEKPWRNSAPNPMAAFWNGRSQWLPTWNIDKDGGKSASLIIDSIKVWAI